MDSVMRSQLDSVERQQSFRAKAGTFARRLAAVGLALAAAAVTVGSTGTVASAAEAEIAEFGGTGPTAAGAPLHQLPMLIESPVMGEPLLVPPRRSAPSWAAGFDFVFAQPRLSDNLGLIEHDEDALGNSVIRPHRFEHDFELSPRVWLAYQTGADIGLRATWWQLDAAADPLRANPPASGFGEVSHPELDGVDLSSVVPAESLFAESSLELYTIDLEITKAARLARWDLLFAAGLRHAAYDRWYGLTLQNAAGDLAGRASLDQRSSGLGPTVSFATSRMAFERLKLSASLRASLLLAESESRLAAIEDADLATEFTTERHDEADDLLPIVETHLRADWIGNETGYGRWLLSGGVEAQWWSGVGTASDKEADLAILGLTIGTGWQW